MISSEVGFRMARTTQRDQVLRRAVVFVVIDMVNRHLARRLAFTANLTLIIVSLPDKSSKFGRPISWIRLKTFSTLPSGALLAFRFVLKPASAAVVVTVFAAVVTNPIAADGFLRFTGHAGQRDISALPSTGLFTFSRAGRTVAAQFIRLRAFHHPLHATRWTGHCNWATAKLRQRALTPLSVIA